MYGVKIIGFRTFELWPLCVFIKYWGLFTHDWSTKIFHCSGFNSLCIQSFVQHLSVSVKLFCIQRALLKHPDSRLDRSHFPIKCRLLHSHKMSPETVFLKLNYYGYLPGGFSHWHGIRICACLLGRFFAKFGIAIGGFHHRRRSPNYRNWVYFGQIIVKSTQFDPNWVLFFRKWYTDGWEIWQKIGIEIVRFSRSGRHIHVRFWWKTPSPGGYLLFRCF